MVDVGDGDVFVGDTDLYVVSGQELIVSHVVLLHPHESRRGVRLGVAVPLLAACCNLFYVFPEFFRIGGKHFVVALLRRLPMPFPVDELFFVDVPHVLVAGEHVLQIFGHILGVCLDPHARAGELFVDVLQEMCDLSKKAVSRLFRRLLPDPAILVGIRLKLRPVDVEMGEVGAFLLKDGLIDVIEDFLDAPFHDIVDEIAEGAVRRRRMVHEIHVADVDTTLLFKTTQGDVSVFHESEQDGLQHAGRIVSYAPHDVFGDVAQVLLYVDSLHESLEDQHGVRNVQKIRDKEWQSCLFWCRIMLGELVFHIMILPQKQGVCFLADALFLL